MFLLNMVTNRSALYTVVAYFSKAKKTTPQNVNDLPIRFRDEKYIQILPSHNSTPPGTHGKTKGIHSTFPLMLRIKTTKRRRMSGRPRTSYQGRGP
jgi:hypothetical protein